MSQKNYRKQLCTVDRRSQERPGHGGKRRRRRKRRAPAPLPCHSRPPNHWKRRNAQSANASWRRETTMSRVRPKSVLIDVAERVPTARKWPPPMTCRPSQPFPTRKCLPKSPFDPCSRCREWWLTWPVPNRRPGMKARQRRLRRRCCPNSTPRPRVSLPGAFTLTSIPILSHYFSFQYQWLENFQHEKKEVFYGRLLRKTRLIVPFELLSPELKFFILILIFYLLSNTHCIIPLCRVTVFIHWGIIPVGKFSRKCAKSINQA